jgi:pilus assembly protein CpaC
VKARLALTIALVSAMTLVFCPNPALHAQAAAEAVQAGTPAAQTSTPTPQVKVPDAQPPAPVPQPVLQPVGPTTQDSSNDLSVSVGKSVVLDLAKPITRIVVGLGDFAEAIAMSPTQVLVNGKAPGETTLILWDASGGRQFFNVTVRASNFVSNDRLESLRRELRAELPGQPLKVSEEDGNIFLRGTVRDLNSSARAVTIAATAGKVVNLLNVDVPAGEPQILLKVRFEAVDRTKENQLGLNLFSTGAANTIGSVSTGGFSPPTLTLPNGSGSATVSLTNALQLFAFYPGINLGATIEALETRGLVETLAEPNVLAENGKQASFLAGGQFPYPVAQGAGAGSGAVITIQFKDYGVRLSFIPTITPRGTIHLQVAPEVSALDYADSVTISGFTVPAITVRRVKTEIELQDGQSFAIGGLLNNTESETFLKIPFLGDIPILGRFFQSIQRTKQNNELIVIVTPEIVNPIPAGAPLPEPRFPVAFLPPNSAVPMHNPDTKTAETTPAPPPATMPVEQLIESMKPEKPLTDQSGGMNPGGGGGGASTGP